VVGPRWWQRGGQGRGRPAADLTFPAVRDLASSFDDVAAAYEHGRPRYDAHVVAEIAAAAGGPRVLDVGAGTGRMSGPLLAAGFDVVAVEPLDAMRTILARSIGPQRALAGRAEDLPLDDASVDGAVCCDAWHWFDGARAADELHRVVRPGGGVVVCVTHPRWHRGDQAPAWWAEVGEIYDSVPKDGHPYLSGSRRPDGLEGHPGFEPMTTRDVPFVHATDRERMVAHYASMSFVATLQPARRAEVLGAVDAVLARHGVDRVDVPYRAELWITRRRRDPAPPAGPRAAAS
jgi:SAM-dependent methyltransferase